METQQAEVTTSAVREDTLPRRNKTPGNISDQRAVPTIHGISSQRSTLNFIMTMSPADMPTSDIPIDDSHPMADGQQRRRTLQSLSYSSIRLTTVAALTVAVSCLWMSPASGFISAPRTLMANGVANSNFNQKASFGLQLNERPYGRFIHLYLAIGGSSSDKEEWRAILASFQLYKAAYGDMKIPTRFVVPSMKPWPGEFAVVLLVTKFVDFLYDVI